MKLLPARIAVASVSFLWGCALAPNDRPSLREDLRNLGNPASLRGHAEARAALARRGPAVVAELVPLLSDADRDVRAGAILALGMSPAQARVAVEALIENLRDPDEWIRTVAASTLGEVVPTMGPGARPAVLALVRMLSDPVLRSSGSSACFQAASALGAIGPAAAEASAALENLAADRRVSSATQAEAHSALERIRSTTAPRFPLESARDKR